MASPYCPRFDWQSFLVGAVIVAGLTLGFALQDTDAETGSKKPSVISWVFWGIALLACFYIFYTLYGQWSCGRRMRRGYGRY